MENIKKIAHLEYVQKNKFLQKYIWWKNNQQNNV